MVDLWSGNIVLADDFVVDDFVTHVAPLAWAADVGEGAGREALQQWISGGVRLLIPDMQFSVDERRHPVLRATDRHDAVLA